MCVVTGSRIWIIYDSNYHFTSLCLSWYVWCDSDHFRFGKRYLTWLRLVFFFFGVIKYDIFHSDIWSLMIRNPAVFIVTWKFACHSTTMTCLSVYLQWPLSLSLSDTRQEPQFTLRWVNTSEQASPAQITLQHGCSHGTCYLTRNYKKQTNLQTLLCID